MIICAQYSPRTLPYAPGQGPRTTIPSTVDDGHVPSLYIALKIFGRRQLPTPRHRKRDITAFAVESVAKLVPTTVINPVPR